MAQTTIDTPPKQKAEPFDSSRWRVPRREFAAEHDAAKADAKAARTTIKVVQAWKARHKFPQDQRLTPASLERLRHEVESARREATGQERHSTATLAAARERLTPSMAAAIAAAASAVTERQTVKGEPWGIPTGSELAKEAARASSEFLLSAIEAVGIKRRTKLVPAVWHELEAAFPVAADHQPSGWHRALYWGAVIRLADTRGEPPADPAAFLAWCRFDVMAQSRAERVEAKRRGMDDAFRRLMGIDKGISESTARERLALPASGPINESAIRSAYRKLAAEHHPDRGGDPPAFQRLTEARDRLLTAATCRP